MGKSHDLAVLAGKTTRLNTVANSTGALSNRNLIINGAMQVAQRGTSATITTAGNSFDALDRFECYRNSSYAPNFTISQDTTGPAGFSKSLKIDVNATATPTGSQNFGIRNKVEGFDAAQTGLGTSGSKQITLSFYVKSNKTGTYGTQIFRNGSTTYSTTKGYTIDAADTWERKEITYTAFTTNNTPQVGNSWGIMIHFDLSSGPDDLVAPFDWTAQGSARTVTGQVNLMDSTSNYWQITGVQLEVGEKATDFEHRSYSDELAKCQRYFEKIAYDGTKLYIGGGMWYNSSSPYVGCKFKTTKRADPTVTIATGEYTWYVAGSSRSSTSLNVSRQTPYSCRLTQSGGLTGSGGTNPSGTHATWLELNTNGSISIDAEL